MSEENLEPVAAEPDAELVADLEAVEEDECLDADDDGLDADDGLI